MFTGNRKFGFMNNFRHRIQGLGGQRPGGMDDATRGNPGPMGGGGPMYPPPPPMRNFPPPPPSNPMMHPMDQVNGRMPPMQPNGPMLHPPMQMGGVGQQEQSNVANNLMQQAQRMRFGNNGPAGPYGGIMGGLGQRG
jgi:hypothetical protein